MLPLTNMEHKLEEAIVDGIRGDLQLGHFNILSVPTFQKLPKLTRLYFFSFLKCWLIFDCPFR